MTKTRERPMDAVQVVACHQQVDVLGESAEPRLEKTHASDDGIGDFEIIQPLADPLQG
jgi:hypothetical protein